MLLIYDIEHVAKRMSQLKREVLELRRLAETKTVTGLEHSRSIFSSDKGMVTGATVEVGHT